ncbi:alkylmercury lyase [Rhodococcus pyridinivorans]|uniref:alkylmercury lyase n=1 Tax=Rhodococcus pyridinivorans TaxID=103816 RepID=UPI002283E842|nr:alkylmercury lyase [Rhodococcus pyridinivorans]WAL49777.1 alkylmercury lyase [Rhodococcus pyridinivorans]
MKVQILYFDGCPNWQEAGDRVRAASVAAQLPDLEIEYRRIESDDKTAALPFAGSPTILLDGIDVFDDAVPVTELACRLYPSETGSAGLPTVEQLTEALRARS